jgi:hypothetical protein
VAPDNADQPQRGATMINQNHGIFSDEVPALIRGLTKILESGIGIDMATTNSKLHLLE